MTRRCSILPVFISGGRGAPWNICPNASTGLSACACSTNTPAAASKQSARRRTRVSPRFQHLMFDSKKLSDR